MDKSEFASKSIDVLKRDLAHLREELRELRFRVSQNQHKDVRDVREKKRAIARLLTEINSRNKS